MNIAADSPSPSLRYPQIIVLYEYAIIGIPLGQSLVVNDFALNTEYSELVIPYMAPAVAIILLAARFLLWPRLSTARVKSEIAAMTDVEEINRIVVKKYRLHSIVVSSLYAAAAAGGLACFMLAPFWGYLLCIGIPLSLIAVEFPRQSHYRGWVSLLNRQ